MSGLAVTEMPGTASEALEPRRLDAWAPLLIGALLGALSAGRFETAIACALIAGAGAAALKARRPRPGWIVMLGASLVTALVLNLYLVRGHALALPRIFGLVPTREGLALGALLALRLFGAALAMRALAALRP